MGVLHIRVTSADQVITIPRTIHSQNFTWIRSIVQSTPTAAAGAKIHGGGLCMDCSFLQGSQMTSNVASNLVIPMFEHQAMNDTQYVQNFDAEDVRTRFVIRTLNFAADAPAVYGTGAGELSSVDLFFEFTELSPVSY